MGEIKLSILIPTVINREEQFTKLVQKICNTLYDGMSVTGVDCGFGDYVCVYSIRINAEVEIVWAIDDKTIAIGEKRELLYKEAKGYYSWQIDDDDDIADNAIELILKAIDENPDVHCITFEERCDMNGTIKRSNHALKYEKWEDNADGFDFVRSPFYKNAIRTDIAKSVPFPHIRYNEDEQWSMALRPHLKTEVHIDEQLYYYSYYPKESHEERYGIEKK